MKTVCRQAFSMLPTWPLNGEKPVDGLARNGSNGTIVILIVKKPLNGLLACVRRLIKHFHGTSLTIPGRT